MGEWVRKPNCTFYLYYVPYDLWIVDLKIQPLPIISILSIFTWGLFDLYFQTTATKDKRICLDGGDVRV